MCFIKKDIYSLTYCAKCGFDCKTMFIIIYFKCMRNTVIIKDGLDLLYKNMRSITVIYIFNHI